MNDYTFWLVVTIVAVVAVLTLFPIVKKAIQDWDFKRQVEGNRPVRQMEESRRTEDPQYNAALEAEKARAVGNIRRDSTGIGR